jgi:hypothetical protein
MAAFQKFEVFVGNLGIAKVHDFSADTLECYLSNAAASASADNIKSELLEITNENGYAAPEDTQNTASEAAGLLSVIGIDIVITATGSVGPFINTVLFNTTPASPLDPLIGWWNRSSVTLANTDTFTINFGATMFTIT